MSLIEKKFEILNFENDKNPQPKWYAIPVIDFVNALKLWEEHKDCWEEYGCELGIEFRESPDLSIRNYSDYLLWLHDKLFGSVSEWEEKR